MVHMKDKNIYQDLRHRCVSLGVCVCVCVFARVHLSIVCNAVRLAVSYFDWRGESEGSFRALVLIGVGAQSG